MVSPGGVTSPRRSRRLAGLAPAEGCGGYAPQCDKDSGPENHCTGKGLIAATNPLPNFSFSPTSSNTSVFREERVRTKGKMPIGRLSSGGRERDCARKRRSLFQRPSLNPGSSVAKCRDSGLADSVLENECDHHSSNLNRLTATPSTSLQSKSSFVSDSEQPSTSGTIPEQRSKSSNHETTPQEESGGNVPEPGSSGASSSASRACITPSFLGCGYRGLASSIAVPVKGESFCDCPKKGRELQCTCGEENDAAIEWRWDPETKSTATELSADGRDVKFHVNYSSGTAAARGTQAMVDSQYFWEIKMTTPVYGTDMMVGVGTPDVDMNSYRHKFCSMLGRDADSWGLSYLGRIHHKGRSQLYAPRFGQGTIIGVHLDMWHGTVAFYKNRKPLGVAYNGLNGKVLHPMVSSTAARSGMRIIKACSFCTSLQFMCCQVLRRIIPSTLGVIEALDNLPPGLKAFLTNNLGWLLRPSELEPDKSLSDLDLSDSDLSDRTGDRVCSKGGTRKKCGGSQAFKCRLFSCIGSSSGVKPGGSASQAGEVASANVPSCSSTSDYKEDYSGPMLLGAQGRSSEARTSTSLDAMETTDEDPKTGLHIQNPVVCSEPSEGQDPMLAGSPSNGLEGLRRVRKRPFPSSEAKTSGTRDSLQETKRKKS